MFHHSTVNILKTNLIYHISKYSWLLNTVKNLYITCDYTVGPSHLWIQLTSDQKQLFPICGWGSKVGKPWWGIQKYHHGSVGDTSARLASWGAALLTPRQPEHLGLSVPVFLDLTFLVFPCISISINMERLIQALDQ